MPKAAPAATPTALTPTATPTTASTGTTSAAASAGTPFCKQFSQALGYLVSQRSISGIESARDRLKTLSPPAGAQSDYRNSIADLTNWIALLSNHSSQAAQAGNAVGRDGRAVLREAGCS